MKSIAIKLIFFLLCGIAFLWRCDNPEPVKSITNQNNSESKSHDTLVIRRDITNELSGAAYRKRATEYIVVSGTDTSNFMCVFSEKIDNGKVDIDWAHNDNKSLTTYKQKLNEFRIILKKAQNEYNIDSINTVSIGRLAMNGDIAVEVSLQYIQQFGESDKIEKYSTISKFLKESKLGSDFNNVFHNYSIEVENVAVEKVFFSEKKTAYFFDNIEIDSSLAPNKILDAITWVKLKKVKK